MRVLLASRKTTVQPAGSVRLVKVEFVLAAKS